MTRAILPVVRLWALAYYRWALADMQRKGGMHPDMPEVLHSINKWERA